MLTLDLAHEPDDALTVRTAWLYYVAGLTQEETAARLGLNRTRVTRLLSDARDRGLVSVSIQHESARILEVEQTVAQAFGLDFCLSTPPIGFDRAADDEGSLAMQGVVARRAIGSAGANFLRGKIGKGPVTIGVSWGRTLAEVASQLAGVTNPHARFVSLMGSLARSAASHPFEVVQAFASRTGGEGRFLPVPFVADDAQACRLLMSQRTVAETLALAAAADLHLISVGELGESAFLRRTGMMAPDELAGLLDRGAVADSLGRFFDPAGREVDHELARRTLAVDIESLRGRQVVLLAGGPEKIGAIAALLRTGIPKGLIIDGDSAIRLARLAILSNREIGGAGWDSNPA